MREKRSIARSLGAVCLAAAVGALTSGCAIMSASFPVPQSHFSYPNSNVTPIGHVKGHATVTGLSPTVQDADLEEQAIQQALAQKNGDFLVDYTQTMTVRMFPLMFLTLYQTDLEVEGTAVKMEVGKKKLR